MCEKHVSISIVSLYVVEGAIRNLRIGMRVANESIAISPPETLAEFNKKLILIIVSPRASDVAKI